MRWRKSREDELERELHSDLALLGTGVALVKSMLFGLTATDPWTIGLAAAIPPA